MSVSYTHLELDKQGLQELLAIGPAHTSGLALFKDLFEVLPGHFMIYSQDGLLEETYWELTSREHTESYRDTDVYKRQYWYCLRALESPVPLLRSLFLHRRLWPPL